MTRHLFYVHGFDPRGPAAYHAICKDAAESASSGTKLRFAMGPRRKASAISSLWELRPAIEGSFPTLAFEYLGYDDLVRGLWRRWDGWRRVFVAWRILFEFTRVGVMARLARSAPPTFIAVALQALTTAAPPLTAILSAGAAGRIAELTGASLPLIAVIAAAAFAAGFAIARRIEQRLNFSWFTRGLAYVLESSYGEIESFDARWEAFARRIIEVWRRDDVADVVVIGHSLGCAQAVRALAKVAELEPRAAVDKPIRLLTLGHSLPISAKLDRSGRFSHTIESVARTFAWSDMTSERDPASTCAWPIESGSVAVHKLPTDHVDAAAKRRRIHPLEFHFLYLRACDAEGGHDLLSAGLPRLRPARGRIRRLNIFRA